VSTSAEDQGARAETPGAKVSNSSPEESQESRRIAAIAATSAEKGADATQIADAIVTTWHEIDAALGPIVGRGGVAALYRRSLHLTAPAHPWLAGAGQGLQTPMDLAALRSVLAQQPSAAAAAGGGALLQRFHELLTSLVGPSLSEQLLRSVWGSLGGLSARETSP
jgi:hypothetical protein